MGGDVGYLVNPRRLVDPGVERPTAADGAVDAEDLSGSAVHTGTATTVLAEFTVDNAAGETFIAGISGSARFSNLASEGPGDVSEVGVEYHDPETDQWVSRPVYSSGVGYRTAGAHSDWNYPEDGDYRFVVTGPAPMQVWWELELSTAPVWEQPLQEAFDVSNLDFFDELEPYLGATTTLTPISIDDVLSGSRDLADFDTVVAVDDTLLPGVHVSSEPMARGVADLPPSGYGAGDLTRMAGELRSFAENGGNVVLTDDAVRGLGWMGLVAPKAVHRGTVYAGHVHFNTEAGYDDPLADGLDQPGAAAGSDERRQMVEPVPIGYALDDSQPQWYVDRAAIESAGGRVVGLDSGEADRAALAEIPVGAGQVRVLGSLLPFPTTAFYHPLGLGSYAVTDNGYTVLRNLLTWANPNQNVAPDLTGEIDWVASGTPTRVYVDGSNELPE